MREKILKIIAEVLDVEIDKLDVNLRRSEIEEWDSIKHIMIVAEIEELFEIELDIETISDQNITISQLQQMIESKT